MECPLWLHTNDFQIGLITLHIVNKIKTAEKARAGANEIMGQILPTTARHMPQKGAATESYGLPL